MKKFVVMSLAIALCLGAGCPPQENPGPDDNGNPTDPNGGNGGNGGGGGIIDPGDGGNNGGGQVAEPVAVNDNYAAETRLVVVAAQGVLANDTYTSPGQVSAFDSLTTAGGGVTVEPDGAFTYLAPAGYTGVDTFTYTLSDAGGSSVATVSISVTQPPVNGGGGGGGGGEVPSDIGPGTYSGLVAGSSFVDIINDAAAGVEEKGSANETRTFTASGALTKAGGALVQVGDVRTVTFGTRTFTETVTGIVAGTDTLTVNLSTQMVLNGPAGAINVSGIGQEFYQRTNQTTVSYQKLVLMNQPATVFVEFQWLGTLTNP